MARLPRFFIAGTPQHVIQRGNNRQAIFQASGERSFLLALLRRDAARYRVSIHAYVLMSNHVHLLMTPERPDGIPRLMQSTGQTYVRWFNDHHGRTGGLWEGRYRATVVEDERYLFACMRYIELNPVRSGIVERPEDFPWSSFRANAMGEGDGLVRPHGIYQGLGPTRRRRAQMYAEMFRESLPDEQLARIRDACQHGWALGGPAFRAGVDASGRRAARLPMGRPRGGRPKVESDPTSREVESDPTLRG